MSTLTGGHKALAAVALAIGTFMQVLDTSIANVSIPTIAGDLGVSTDQGTWVITSFAVANGVSVPSTGWLMQRFGVVRTFLISVGLFTIASLLCGYISDNYVWPWIFLINVPVGVFCVAVCWRTFKRQETPTRKLPVDRGGLLLLFVWVGALQIMLDQGKDLDWYNSPSICTLLVITLIALVAWLIWELTEQHPVVDLRLFSSRSFTLGTVAFCLGYAVFFGNLVLMPLWLQSFIGYTATWAGMVSAPSGVTAILASLLVGRLMKRVDPRVLGATAFAIFAVSYFMRAGLTSDASVFAFIAPQLVQGFAVGIFFVAMLAVIFDRLPQEMIPAASGLSNFLRIIAGSFATSITTTMWDRREALHQTRLVESLNVYAPPYQDSLVPLQQLGITGQGAAGALAEPLVGQSYLLSSLDLFYLSAVLAVVLIPLCFLVRRPVVSGAVTAAAD
jgi:DHA2 family multidrug resistance protein